MATVTESVKLIQLPQQSSQEGRRLSVGGRDVALCVGSAVGSVIGLAVAVLMAVPLAIPTALGLTFGLVIGGTIADKSRCTWLEGFAMSLRNL